MGHSRIGVVDVDEDHHTDKVWQRNSQVLPEYLFAASAFVAKDPDEGDK
jgi:hypothetical protein